MLPLSYPPYTGTFLYLLQPITPLLPLLYIFIVIR